MLTLVSWFAICHYLCPCGTLWTRHISLAGIYLNCTPDYAFFVSTLWTRYIFSIICNLTFFVYLLLRSFARGVCLLVRSWCAYSSLRGLCLLWGLDVPTHLWEDFASCEDLSAYSWREDFCCWVLLTNVTDFTNSHNCRVVGFTFHILVTCSSSEWKVDWHHCCRHCRQHSPGPLCSLLEHHWLEDG